MPADGGVFFFPRCPNAIAEVDFKSRFFLAGEDLAGVSLLFRRRQKLTFLRGVVETVFKLHSNRAVTTHSSSFSCFPRVVMACGEFLKV